MRRSVREGAAIAALEGADDGALQKSDTLEQVAEKIRFALFAAETRSVSVCANGLTQPVLSTVCVSLPAATAKPNSGHT